MKKEIKITYRNFLIGLKDCFEIRSLKDYEEVSSRSVCLLRHDVDRFMDRALQMARTEHSLNVQSTYFVLPGAEYYESETFIKDCLTLQDLGHEIGLHNNILTTASNTGRKSEDILGEELEYLRGNDIKIFGTAAHGDAACRTLHYINYEIFEGCEAPYKKTSYIFKGVKLHNLKLSDYGLYSAYFLPRDFYLTDCLSAWRYIKGEGDEWHPKFRSNAPCVYDIIKFLKEVTVNKIVLQALLHPNLGLISIEDKKR